MYGYESHYEIYIYVYIYTMVMSIQSAARWYIQHNHPPKPQNLQYIKPQAYLLTTNFLYTDCPV